LTSVHVIGISFPVYHPPEAYASGPLSRYHDTDPYAAGAGGSGGLSNAERRPLTAAKIHVFPGTAYQSERGRRVNEEGHCRGPYQIDKKLGIRMGLATRDSKTKERRPLPLTLATSSVDPAVWSVAN
jgi:hypothetical protein